MLIHLHKWILWKIESTKILNKIIYLGVKVPPSSVELTDSISSSLPTSYFPFQVLCSLSNHCPSNALSLFLCSTWRLPTIDVTVTCVCIVAIVSILLLKRPREYIFYLAPRECCLVLFLSQRLEGNSCLVLFFPFELHWQDSSSTNTWVCVWGTWDVCSIKNKNRGWYELHTLIPQFPHQSMSLNLCYEFNIFFSVSSF